MQILNREEVKKIISVHETIQAVEKVYSLKSEGNIEVWPTVIYDFDTGKKETDIKSGYLKEIEIHGLKAVNWTADNETKGIPSLTGVILLFDTITGCPIGLVDGGYITGIRTGAAGAVGAKYLARKDSKKLFLLGTGEQAVFQLAAFLYVFPELENIYICNIHHPEKAVTFSKTIRERLETEFKLTIDNKLIFEPVVNIEESVNKSDIVVTVTPSRTPVIKKEWIKPGTHLSCIGADMSGKQEIESSIFQCANVFCDDKEHCIEVGEVEIPIKNGYIKPAQIKGEIGEVITGKKHGRNSQEEITIFDATGMAVLDLFTAKAVIEKAKGLDIGESIEF